MKRQALRRTTTTSLRGGLLEPSTIAEVKKTANKVVFDGAKAYYASFKKRDTWGKVKWFVGGPFA